VDQNWYVVEDMNGKQLGKFSAAEDGHCTNLKGVTFLDLLCDIMACHMAAI